MRDDGKPGPGAYELKQTGFQTHLNNSKMGKTGGVGFGTSSRDQLVGTHSKGA